jgi:hypothetical protein
VRSSAVRNVVVVSFAVMSYAVRTIVVVTADKD